MDSKSFAAKIIQLKAADLAFREQLVQSGQLGEGYHKEMEQLHIKNAKALAEIIDVIGYPTVDKVGEAASEAAWLIIQHAISLPSFMKKCETLLKNAVQLQQADPKNLAYLSDRIAVFEGKPQLYGTQFDWNENSEMKPNTFDDLTKVNQRRMAIGLNTLEEQTALIQHRIKNERQSPPPDFNKRKNEMEVWRKQVGWIK